MTHLKLYTTLGCHLCERLEAELARMGRAGISLERIEIAHDPGLVERYGTSIPVLSDGQGDELERGFEPERLAAWLDERGLLAARAESIEAFPPSASAGPRRVRGRRFLN